MSMENCPECGEELTHHSMDSRQEWTRIEYICKKCNKLFSRLITYKTQSSMVLSDEWEKD